MTEKLEKVYKPIIYVITVIVSNIVLLVNEAIDYSTVSTTGLGVLTFVLILDSVTGVMAAVQRYKKDKKVKVSSAKGKNGILFKLSMLIVIVASGALLRVLGVEASFFLMTIISLLAAYESFSVIGNIQTIRTGEPKVEYDAISLLLRALQKRFKKAFFAGLSVLAGEPIQEDGDKYVDSYPIEPNTNNEEEIKEENE